MKWNFKNSLMKNKITMSLTLLIIAAIGSIIVSYKSTGVFLRNERKLPIYNVATEEKKIAITFDVSCGEIDNVGKVLDILDKNHIKATFFIVGDYLDAHPEMVKAIKERGQELGNHSNSHPHITTLPKAKIMREIQLADAKIFKITGQGTNLFRCPEGEYNNMVIDTVKESSHYCIQWDVDSIDWKEQGADLEYNRIVERAKPGSILLFHNTAKYTEGNLEKIIKDFKGRGYSFVTVSELIYKDNYYINSEGKQIKR